MLDINQLQVAVAAAKRRFDLLREKFPALKAYLVISLRGGQTRIDSAPAQILSEFPAMVVDDGNKTTALKFLFPLEILNEKLETARGIEAERLKEQKTRLEAKLNKPVSKLKYNEKCQVEIRFEDLNYDLIRKLQVDDLVDRNLTPQTKAAIRIVLSTLSQFETP